MSYTVTRHTREIGIRVALGAQRENILWMVLREGLVMALFGIAIGIPSALVATRLIASMLFGISTNDPAYDHRRCPPLPLGCVVGRISTSSACLRD
jgi:ABC-type antimicrobial peptide transport system permease subunit